MSLFRLESKGASFGDMMDNLVTGDGPKGDLLQKAKPAMTTTSAVMLQGIALFQSGDWVALLTPIGDAVAGSVSTSFTSIRASAMS